MPLSRLPSEVIESLRGHGERGRVKEEEVPPTATVKPARKFTPRRYFEGSDVLDQTSLVKEFRCLAMDPPWFLKGAGKNKRGPDRYYPVLKTPEILDVIQKSGVFLPCEDAHLWMWVINGFLPDGLWLMEHLGFRYVKTFTWWKPDAGPGMGFYGRDDTEQLFFGVRGNLPPLPTARKVRTHIPAFRGRHSEKPTKAYTDVIEKITPGPRLEMFARTPREGWTVWGDDPAVQAQRAS
jgi:N6-adenosine-specific RNA methylase IME4